MTWLDVVALILATGWVVWLICRTDRALLNGRTRPRRYRPWGRIR